MRWKESSLPLSSPPIFLKAREETPNSSLWKIKKPMTIEYRLATLDDVSGISSAFVESGDDLYRKRGFFQAATPSVPANPVFAYQIKMTPQAFWVAQEDRKIIGFSASFIRGPLWYFSWLFITPSYQGRGVGRALLEKMLDSWNGVKITNRATMTFAFNPSSQFLYMKYRMYPREPVYYVETTGKRILENPLQSDQTEDLNFEEMSLKESCGIVRQLDESVLGFSMEWNHDFCFETKNKCYIFKKKNDDRTVVGYVYVSPSGKVGPLAVSSSDLVKPILGKALRLSAEQKGVEKVRYYFPGSNVGAVDLALKYNMCFEPYVFMSTKPFAKWENYLFHSAALM
jgi:GNAT superfamily N-acetyltransferase